jgi:hypothetical protein
MKSVARRISRPGSSCQGWSQCGREERRGPLPCDEGQGNRTPFRVVLVSPEANRSPVIGRFINVAGLLNIAVEKATCAVPLPGRRIPGSNQGESVPDLLC